MQCPNGLRTQARACKAPASSAASVLVATPPSWATQRCAGRQPGRQYRFHSSKARQIGSPAGALSALPG